MTATYTRNADDTVTVTHDTDWVGRRSEQTARYDSSILVPAGSFTLRPIHIGGQPATFDDAYYFIGGIDGVLQSGGYDDEVIGVTVKRVSMMPYGYMVRDALAKQAAEPQ